MRDFVTGVLYGVVIGAIAFAAAVALVKSGIGDLKANLFTAGWVAALFFEDLEARGWF